MNATSYTLLAAVFITAAGCKKETEKVVVTEKGNVVAVKNTDGTTTDKVVVVKDSDLIWPSAEAAIRSQIDATNSEDLETYISYVHPDSVDFPDAKARAAKIFADNDLRTTVESLTAESVTSGEVKARFVQRTEKLSGGEFRNNRVTGVHTLRKDGDMWKLFSTRVDKVDYLAPPPP